MQVVDWSAFALYALFIPVCVYTSDAVALEDIEEVFMPKNS